MWIVYVGLPVIVLLAVYLLWKVQGEYKTQGKLSAQTALGVWVVYLLHAGLTGFTAWHAFWPFPIGKTVSVAIGGVFLFFGLALSVAGIITFRSFKRMSGLEANKLVTSGIYRWSRNPQNVGWGLVLLGIALIGRSAIALILVALFGLVLHVYLVLVEEEYLEQVFGEEYRRYRSRTSRYLGWPEGG
ncbi:MAG: methyltransferase family protein [Anaerolineae bacterium]